MALTDPHAPGATPLTPVQLRGLRLPLTTHGELNAAEQENILRARLWARGARSIAMPNILTREFVEQLHLRMYGDVPDIRARGIRCSLTPQGCVHSSRFSVFVQR